MQLGPCLYSLPSDNTAVLDITQLLYPEHFETQNEGIALFSLGLHPRTPTLAGPRISFGPETVPRTPESGPRMTPKLAQNAHLGLPRINQKHLHQAAIARRHMAVAPKCCSVVLALALGAP
jgi:hypothetical protein